MDAQELIRRTMHAVVPNASTVDRFTPIFVSGIGQPSVDGSIFPDVASRLTPHPVDLLHGMNSGEVLMQPPNGIPGGPLTFFRQHLGHVAADRVLAQYDLAQTKDADLIADACMRCNSVKFARRVAAQHSGAQVKMYLYDNPRYASFHGADVPAVFGTADHLIMPDGSVNTSEALVHKIQTIWTQFAKGENITKLLPHWPEMPPGHGGVVHTMVIGEGDHDHVRGIDTSPCDEWAAATDAIGGWATARMCNDFYAGGRL